jgi:predicted Rossmann fold flavoprotein
MTAVGHANEQGEVVGKIEEFPEAKAGVEMIARAGGDLRFGGVKAFGGGDFAGGHGDGKFGGMHHQGMDGEFIGDFMSEPAESFGITGCGRQVQDLTDFVGFLLVEPKDDIEILLELPDELEGVPDIVVGPFLGVGEVEEHFAARAGELRAEFLEDGLPDLAHVGEHGPIDEADEAGLFEFPGELIAAEPGDDVGPGDFLEGGVFTDHDFAVVELEGIGVAGIGDAVQFGLFGEVVEHGVEIRVTEDAKVGDFDAEAGEGVGHDRPVATKLGDVRDDLEVGAFAGRRGHAPRELRDRIHAGELLGRLAFVDDMNDFIDEPVQADEGGEVGNTRGGLDEAFGALMAEFRRVDHSSPGFFTVIRLFQAVFVVVRLRTRNGVAYLEGTTNAVTDAVKARYPCSPLPVTLRRMHSRRNIVVGGGAAGFFAAITCAEAQPASEVILLEKSAQFLSKVRISGGGRCNVTHACEDVAELSRHYPRGGRALIGAFQRFGPADTVAWFEQRRVPLKTEPDGRMFPRSDSSESIIDCLVESATSSGVRLRSNCGVTGIRARIGGGFQLALADGDQAECDRLLLAPGGCRAAAAAELATALGHTIEPPVPSLFTFQVPWPALNRMAGIAVEDVEVAVPDFRLKARGPLLLTHAGLSGPAILRLSAWGARVLHGADYRFGLQVNWLPSLAPEAIAAKLDAIRRAQPARMITTVSLPPLPARLWAFLVEAAGVAAVTRWAELSRAAEHRLVQQLTRTVLPVNGKSLNKEEFVTCGGIRLGEIDFKTMESRIVPGLHFAGEVLDMDGLTGGFNFQAAWTTGWIAGQAMARP